MGESLCKNGKIVNYEKKKASVRLGYSRNPYSRGVVFVSRVGCGFRGEFM
jgi:hypothetical protein